MGYRSDVVIRLNKNARDKMPENVKGYLELWACGNVKQLEEGGVIYEIGDIKWYGANDDVSAVEDFLDSLDIDEDEEYELVRCGEDDDDNEQRGNGDEFQMWIDRTINYENCL